LIEQLGKYQGRRALLGSRLAALLSHLANHSQDLIELRPALRQDQFNATIDDWTICNVIGHSFLSF